jgi:hypothetical protein
MRALQAIGASSRLISVIRLRAIRICLLETLPLIVPSQASIALSAITVFLVVGAALARMNHAGVHTLLRQALGSILTFAGHRNYPLL